MTKYFKDSRDFEELYRHLWAMARAIALYKLGKTVKIETLKPTDSVSVSYTSGTRKVTDIVED